MCFGGRPIQADLMGVLGREEDEIYTDSPCICKVFKNEMTERVFSQSGAHGLSSPRPEAKLPNPIGKFQSNKAALYRIRYVGYTTQKSASH
jgi:hypothetical protein